MYGETTIFLYHSLSKQTGRLNHNTSIACLYRTRNVLKISIFTNMKKFHHAHHHTLWRVAITRDDSLRQRTMIHPYSYCRAVLFAHIKQRKNIFTDFLQFSRIFLVAIVVFSQRTNIDVVSRVDSHLLHIFCSNQRRLRIKVNVGNQWLCVTTCHKLLLYIFQIFGFLYTLCRQTDIIATGIEHTYALLNTRLGIVRIGVGH